MKFKIVAFFIILIVVMGAIFSIYDEAQNYSKFMLNEARISSGSISKYLNDAISFISNLKLTGFPSATSTVIEGYALMNLNGEVVYDFNMPSEYTGKDSYVYKYVILKGKYISPLLESSTGKPLMLLASETSDGNHLAVAMIEPMDLNVSNAFLVDKTGLGVSLSGNWKWRNFLSVMALEENGVIMKDGFTFFVEPVGLGGYKILIQKTRYAPFLISRNLIYIWLGVLTSLLILFCASYHRITKNVKSVVEFTDFIKRLDRFEKYEGPKDELTFKYNQLVDKHEKLDRDYSDLIKDMSETNVELVEVNKLLIEFSMLFNEVKAERKSLEEALRMAFRRMLDFSKPITGIGMKYGKLEIYLGTVNSFNFEMNGEDRISLNLKTDSSEVKYVVNTDRFITNERTKEMIRTLLYHLTTFLSMYELLEKTTSFMKYDPLTGLLTRQEFEELVKKEEALAKRENKHLSFMMIDVNRMRNFNEKYGRLNGDVLLKYVAKVINKNIRLTDIAARYGEDEFIVCFYGMKKEDGVKKCEQIVSQIHEFRYEVDVKHTILTYPIDGNDALKLISLLEKTLQIDMNP